MFNFLFGRNRKREIIAPYIQAASMEICFYLQSLKTGTISDSEVKKGFQILAHNRLFMPSGIAEDFQSLLCQRSNSNNEAAEIAARMRAYAKRYR